MLDAYAFCVGFTKLDAYAVGASAIESLGTVKQMRDLSLNLRTPAPGEHAKWKLKCSGGSQLYLPVAGACHERNIL